IDVRGDKDCDRQEDELQHGFPDRNGTRSGQSELILIAPRFAGFSDVHEGILQRHMQRRVRCYPRSSLADIGKHRHTIQHA
ncbi:hypothetical protein ABTL34_19550, partial [Acinetobacter baumannii]